MVEQIREDIRQFKASHGCERVVVIWAASTEIYVPVDEKVHGSLQALFIRRNCLSLLSFLNQTNKQNEYDEICIKRVWITAHGSCPRIVGVMQEWQQDRP